MRISVSDRRGQKVVWASLVEDSRVSRLIEPLLIGGLLRRLRKAAAVSVFACFLGNEIRIYKNSLMYEQVSNFVEPTCFNSATVLYSWLKDDELRLRHVSDFESTCCVLTKISHWCASRTVVCLKIVGGIWKAQVDVCWERHPREDNGFRHRDVGQLPVHFLVDSVLAELLLILIFDVYVLEGCLLGG